MVVRELRRKYILIKHTIVMGDMVLANAFVPHRQIRYFIVGMYTIVYVLYPVAC